MLPGLRFLFAATMLTLSTLIFGFGAAALLRAAHDEVASNPSRRVLPETKFAAPHEPARPTLALLRVEPQPAEAKPAEEVAAPEPAPQPAAALPPADRVAALGGESAALPEAAKPEMPIALAPVEAEAAPAAAEAPAPADPTSLASSEPIAPASEAAAPAPEPAGTAGSEAADIGSTMAATKIATLGGPPVSIETAPPARTAGAAADPAATKKRQQAREAKERRRVAQRARVPHQATPQQPADPFSQPTITTRTR